MIDDRRSPQPLTSRLPAALFAGLALIFLAIGIILAMSHNDVLVGISGLLFTWMMVCAFAAHITFRETRPRRQRALSQFDRNGIPLGGYVRLMRSRPF